MLTGNPFSRPPKPPAEKTWLLVDGDVVVNAVRWCGDPAVWQPDDGVEVVPWDGVAWIGWVRDGDGWRPPDDELGEDDD